MPMAIVIDVLLAAHYFSNHALQICNAVTVARILNATLLIPHFQINPVWLDAR